MEKRYIIKGRLIKGYQGGFITLNISLALSVIDKENGVYQKAQWLSTFVLRWGKV